MSELVRGRTSSASRVEVDQRPQPAGHPRLGTPGSITLPYHAGARLEALFGGQEGGKAIGGGDSYRTWWQAASWSSVSVRVDVCEVGAESGSLETLRDGDGWAHPCPALPWSWSFLVLWAVRTIPGPPALDGRQRRVADSLYRLIHPCDLPPHRATGRSTLALGTGGCGPRANECSSCVAVEEGRDGRGPKDSRRDGPLD